MSGISGDIPDIFTNLNQLVELEFSYNSLTGQIPSSLGAPPLIKSIILDSNPTISTLPESLGNLGKLTTLFMIFATFSY